MDQKDYATRLKVIATNEYYSWRFISRIIGISTETLRRFVTLKTIGPRSMALIKEYIDHYENAKY